MSSSAVRPLLEERVKMALACDKNPNKQAAAAEMCRRNILFFFRYFLWTYDPRISPSEIPFVPHDYQRDYIDTVMSNIDKGVSLLTQKSRDMGVTWMILGVFLYRWMFRNENFLLGSRKEEYVDKIGDMDTHFERLRFMARLLPNWLVAACGWQRKNDGYLKLYKDNGASIVGEAMGPYFSRQGRHKAILLDEFAFVEQAEAAWRSCGDSALCKLVVSTVNGRTFFSQLRDSGKLKVVKLGWFLHPLKTKEWYDAEKLKRSERDMAQELDMNEIVASGKPFYSGFRENLHVRELKYNPAAPIYRAWDFGWHHPACSWNQCINNRWYILAELMGNSITIDRFGQEVKLASRELFPDGIFSDIDFGDPAGNQKNDKSERTSVEILAAMGINVVSKISTYRERKEIIEKKLLTLNPSDGLPELLIDSSCKIIRDGFLGGYHYPEYIDGRQFNSKVMEVPYRDSYYEHLMNTVEYFAVNMFTGAESRQSNAEITVRTVGPMKDIKIEYDEEETNHNNYKLATQGVFV